jgi:hypothetical protein
MNFTPHTSHCGRRPPAPNSLDLTTEREHSETRSFIVIQSPCHNATKRTHNSTRKGGLRPSRNAPELGPTTRVPTGWSTARHKHHLHKSLHRAAPLMICILFLFHGLEFCPMISRSLYEMWPLSEQRIYTPIRLPRRAPNEARVSCHPEADHKKHQIPRSANPQPRALQAVSR